MFKEFCYYLYEIHTGKESDKNKFFSALIGISFLQEMNILSIWGTINYLFDLVVPIDSIVFVGISLWIFITGINYFIIFKKRNYIMKRVNEFSIKREKVGKMFFLFYIIVTLFYIYYVIQNLTPIKS